MHVAIIMDGNGRWADRRGLPRAAGHRAGARAVDVTVEAARRAGVAALTLYAFSCDNWKRPASEVDALMGLFERYLGREAQRCARHGIRLRVIGRRDRLAPSLLAAIARAEERTSAGQSMTLSLAVDYSSRHALRAGALEPDVDLLIRTGGERRLSDFLLWECAYAELHFCDRLWPDFTAADLDAALAWFATRQRRFGALPATA